MLSRVVLLVVSRMYGFGSGINVDALLGVGLTRMPSVLLDAVETVLGNSALKRVSATSPMGGTGTLRGPPVA